MLEKNKKIASTRKDPHEPFGKQKILEIVAEVEKGLDRKSACVKYGMAYSTLCEWMVTYGSEIYQSGKRALYSSIQKRSIVRAIHEGKMTKQEACIAYKLNRKLLNSWIAKFRKEFSDLSTYNQDNMGEMKITAADKAIDKELFEARLKIKALETMIDIAEEQFKISIRKKFGAKQ
jgi:transposase